MERAKQIWEQELGLPPLRPQRLWYGDSLGQWDAEAQQEAELALKGECYKPVIKWLNGESPCRPSTEKNSPGHDITEDRVLWR